MLLKDYMVPDLPTLRLFVFLKMSSILAEFLELLEWLE
jgi:hypothetical protein